MMLFVVSIIGVLSFIGFFICFCESALNRNAHRFYDLMIPHLFACGCGSLIFLIILVLAERIL